MSISVASSDSLMLKRWLDGDLQARDELLRNVSGRLERLARKMLRRFPSVQRWAETGDVLQESLLRLCKSLEEVRPTSMRAFFGLAATQMRRQLLDLARKFYGPQGIGAHHPGDPGAGDASTISRLDPPASAVDVADLENWQRLHQAIEELPTDEREVVSLIFYHGWTQAEVAELFQVTERTIRRWWLSARLKLHECLADFDRPG